MLNQIIIGLILSLISSSLLMAQQKHSPADLDQYQWENRLVLTFAPADSSPKYRQQLREFKGNEEGFNDRDLKVFGLFSKGGSVVGMHKISNSAAARLYDKYNIKKGAWSVILIGKDGTEKLRTSDLLATKKLFSVIDAMPMRRREMQNNK